MTMSFGYQPESAEVAELIRNLAASGQLTQILAQSSLGESAQSVTSGAMHDGCKRRLTDSALSSVSDFDIIASEKSSSMSETTQQNPITPRMENVKTYVLPDGVGV